MKHFFAKYKKKILQIGIVFAVIICLAVAIYFIFDYFNITDVETLKKIISDCGEYKYIVFLVLQVVLTVLLCFIPASNMSFIALGVLLFGANYKTFLLCFSGVIISSILMDFLGRFGLKKVFEKIIVAEDLEKAENLINKYGKGYIPLFYLFPLFPDDAICCVVGSLKVNFWYHLFSIILCRGVGVATIVFGVALIPEDVQNFTSTDPREYIQVITVAAFWVIVAFYLATKANKFFEKYKEKKDINKKTISNIKGNKIRQNQKKKGKMIVRKKK